MDVPIPTGSDGPQGRLNFSQNPAVPKDQQAAYRAAIGMCTNEGLRPFIPFLNALAPLQKAWADDLAKLPDNPEVRSETAKWRTCMDADGITSTTPQAFFASLDAKAAALPKAEYIAEQSKLVKTYAKCVKGLADAQDRVRTGYRKQLSDDFAPQIADLQSQMNALVTRLSTQYGVRYGDEH
ncbi:MAG: hypothetical protein JST73_08875 [Actinobacteria bacterium]|nr:hypothetical protein [Actinomycetota bacterium]